MVGKQLIMIQLSLSVDAPRWQHTRAPPSLQQKAAPIRAVSPTVMALHSYIDTCTLYNLYLMRIDFQLNYKVFALFIE